MSWTIKSDDASREKEHMDRVKRWADELKKKLHREDVIKETGDPKHELMEDIVKKAPRRYGSGWVVKAADEPQGAVEIIVSQLNKMNGQGIKIADPDRLSAALNELAESILLGGLTMDMLDFLSVKGTIQLTNEEQAAKAIESLKSGG